jgi:hypothetical protein
MTGGSWTIGRRPSTRSVSLRCAAMLSRAYARRTLSRTERRLFFERMTRNPGVAGSMAWCAYQTAILL